MSVRRFAFANLKLMNLHSQSPTFNATPVVDACIAACLRGIEVTLYLDLGTSFINSSNISNEVITSHTGFNDLGEMIPFQGGTNKEVISNVYKDLNAKSKGGT